jgi:hypothetical protein
MREAAAEDAKRQARVERELERLGLSDDSGRVGETAGQQPASR